MKQVDRTDRHIKQGCELKFNFVSRHRKRLDQYLTAPQFRACAVIEVPNYT
jgi:hypothetical protein